MEVVVVYGPEHDSAEFVYRSVFALSTGHSLVIVADPLILSVSVWTHCRWIWLNNRPVLILFDALADLKGSMIRGWIQSQ